MVLIIDLLAVVIGLGAVLGVVGIVRMKYLETPKLKVMVQGKQARLQGEVNVLKLTEEQKRYCVMCNKQTQSNLDLYLDGDWVHTACFVTKSKEKSV